MSIDFEIPPEAKAVRERVRQWVKDECIPAESRIKDKASYQEVLNELRTKARFIQVTGAAVQEGHPHDIVITQEAPNYSSFASDGEIGRGNV